LLLSEANEGDFEDAIEGNDADIKTKKSSTSFKLSSNLLNQYSQLHRLSGNI
jgi:hypothetical protein